MNPIDDAGSEEILEFSLIPNKFEFAYKKELDRFFECMEKNNDEIVHEQVLLAYFIACVPTLLELIFHYY